jgi:hypothetical protein
MADNDNGFSGNGFGGFKSLGVLQSIAAPGSTLNSSLIWDAAGVLLGGALGWWVTKKYSKSSSPLMGVLIGAELGLLLIQKVKPAPTLVGKESLGGTL